MDINLMVLNAGNTRLAVGVFVAGILDSVERVAIDDQAGWKDVISRGWEKIKSHKSPGVAGASVNASVENALVKAVEEVTGQELEWVGPEIDISEKIAVPEPTKVGIDRVLNVLAAFEQTEAATVVIDAGTAITIDACDDKGNFIGGAIAPGASLMLRSLNEHTSKLPLVTLEKPCDAIGKDTTDAIRNGVYHGLRGMVKELLENYATHFGRWPEVVATGGDAKLLFEGSEYVPSVVPDLTLYGIALAYAEHYSK